MTIGDKTVTIFYGFCIRFGPDRPSADDLTKKTVAGFIKKWDIFLQSNGSRKIIHNT